MYENFKKLWNCIFILSVAMSVTGFFCCFRTVAEEKFNVLEIRKGLEAYRQDCEFYPTEQQGLQALWTKPKVDPVPENWNGPYMKNYSRDMYRFVRGTDMNRIIKGENPMKKNVYTLLVVFFVLSIFGCAFFDEDEKNGYEYSIELKNGNAECGALISFANIPDEAEYLRVNLGNRILNSIPRKDFESGFEYKFLEKERTYTFTVRTFDGKYKCLSKDDITITVNDGLGETFIHSEGKLIVENAGEKFYIVWKELPDIKSSLKNQSLIYLFFGTSPESGETDIIGVREVNYNELSLSDKYEICDENIMNLNHKELDKFYVMTVFCGQYSDETLTAEEKCNLSPIYAFPYK